MEVLEIIVVLLGGAASLLAWFFKRTLDGMRVDIKDLQLSDQSIRDIYLQKNDFREFKTELRAMFEELRHDIKDIKRNG